MSYGQPRAVLAAGAGLCAQPRAQRPPAHTHAYPQIGEVVAFLASDSSTYMTGQVSGAVGAMRGGGGFEVAGVPDTATWL